MNYGTLKTEKDAVPKGIERNRKTKFPPRGEEFPFLVKLRFAKWELKQTHRVFPGRPVDCKCSCLYLTINNNSNCSNNSIRVFRAFCP